MIGHAEGELVPVVQRAGGGVQPAADALEVGLGLLDEERHGAGEELAGDAAVKGRGEREGFAGELHRVGVPGRGRRVLAPSQGRRVVQAARAVGRAGAGAEAVDRVGGEGDEAAGGERRDGVDDGLGPLGGVGPEESRRGWSGALFTGAASGPRAPWARATRGSGLRRCGGRRRRRGG